MPASAASSIGAVPLNTSWPSTRTLISRPPFSNSHAYGRFKAAHDAGAEALAIRAIALIGGGGVKAHMGENPSAFGPPRNHFGSLQV